MPTWEDVVEIAKRVPDVEESTWFGTPSVKVRGKGMGPPAHRPWRLEKVDLVELAELVEDAWRTQAPKRLVHEDDAAANG